MYHITILCSVSATVSKLLGIVMMRLTLVESKDRNMVIPLIKNISMALSYGMNHYDHMMIMIT